MYDPDYGTYYGDQRDPRTPELICPECGSGDCHTQNWCGATYVTCNECGHQEADDHYFDS